MNNAAVIFRSTDPFVLFRIANFEINPSTDKNFTRYADQIAKKLLKRCRNI